MGLKCYYFNVVILETNKPFRSVRTFLLSASFALHCANGTLIIDQSLFKFGCLSIYFFTFLFSSHGVHINSSLLKCTGFLFTILSLFMDGVLRKHLDSPYLSPYLRQDLCSYRSTAVHVLPSDGSSVD